MSEYQVVITFKHPYKLTPTKLFNLLRSRLFFKELKVVRMCTVDNEEMVMNKFELEEKGGTRL